MREFRKLIIKYPHIIRIFKNNNYIFSHAGKYNPKRKQVEKWLMKI